MKKKKTTALRAAVLIGSVLLLSALSFYVFFDVAEWQALDHSKLTALAQTSSLFDRYGSLMSEVRGSENRTVVSLSDIPKHTQQAFLAAEDLRFYQHRGIDIFRMLGALRSNIISGSFSEGASTITQQLAKLTHLSAEKTLRRKLEEIWLAIQIESAYGKDEILEMYLNTVYFGRGAYGIQTAARNYFGKDAENLTLAESASLAATIKAPSLYAPHSNPKHNKNRRMYILKTMLENEFITETEYAEAADDDIWVLAAIEETQRYGWYVDEVLRESVALLNISADEVISGGYMIYTAYDPELQEIADKVYRKRDNFPPDAADGTPVQSAFAVLDTTDGAIRAMVGGRNYTTRRGLNRATQMRRQPGSALKPQAVYGPALDLGYTTASILLDEKTSFGGYTPQNAGDRYYGRVTMRTALRNSLNTTAVRLLEEIGIDASIQYLDKFGLPTTPTDRNLSLALGSMTNGVTPVELAAAYIPYANGGVYHAPYCVSRITDANGDVLYERTDAGKRVISEQNAFLMTSLLQSVITNGTGTRLLSANIPVAGKTGTVSMNGGNRDIWMAAYTPEVSVTAWMGYDQTDAQHKIPNGITGGKNTASLAAEFLKEMYAERKKVDFVQPEGLIWLTLDKRALTTKGAVMLASDTTPKDSRVSEVFAVSNRPYAVSDVWDPPASPSSFYVSHDSSGYPVLNFKSIANARYRIQRDAVGESVILTELIGSQGQTLSYSDYQAKPGVLYTYRIIPIHEELLQQGIWLEGKQAVQVAQVSNGYTGFFSGLSGLIPAMVKSP